LSVTQAQPSAALVLDQAWGLHPQIALRDESFGALAYHYGNRRLVFLKSRLLVELVRALGDYDTAADAIAAIVPEEQRSAYGRALLRLADSEVIGAR
jgi:mycofactocin biosynthesis protein MftB